MILRLKICTSVDRNVRVERPGSRTRIGTGSFASALAEQLAALFDEVDEYEEFDEGDELDAADEMVADALDSGDTDEFLSRLRNIAGRVARGVAG